MIENQEEGWHFADIQATFSIVLLIYVFELSHLIKCNHNQIQRGLQLKMFLLFERIYRKLRNGNCTINQ